MTGLSPSFPAGDADGEALVGTREPPHNVEAEQALLGAIFQSNRTYERVSEFLRPEHFANALHARIYDACGRLIEQGQLATPVTLKAYLETDPLLREAGGPAYLAQLANAVVTVVNAADYGRLIHDMAIRRELIDLGQGMVNEAYEVTFERSATDQIEGAEQRLYDLATKGQQEGGFQDFRYALTTAISMAEAAHRREGELSGVPTDLADLDKKLGGLHPSDLLILAGRPSMGKAQPLDAMVKTVDGWKRMGDLRVGDALASVDGRPSRVRALFPQDVKQIYRVTFSDGRSTEVCDEHLWRVYYREWPAPRVLETAEIAKMLTRTRYRHRLWVDHCSGDFGHDEALPVDPWALGALLGDGNLKGGSARFSTASAECLATLGEALGEEFVLRAAGGYGHCVVQAAGHHRPGHWGVSPNALKDALKELGLWDVSGQDKFVPELYMTANRESRLAVLRGLLDTDGWVERWGSVRFCTVSRRLAENVRDLARSLGGWATLKEKAPRYTHNSEHRRGRTAYVVNIHIDHPRDLFSLPEKKARVATGPKRRKMPVIVSIEPTRRAEAQCIAVSHPDRLYITDGYVVTHNTALATNIAFNAARRYQERKNDDGTTEVVDGAKVAFFSLEMSAEQLATRLLAQEAEISSHKIRTGELSNDDFARMVQVAQELHSLPLFIDDTPALSVSAVRTRCRRLQRQQGLGLIVIDYLQLLSAGPGDRSDSRVNEVSAITRGLKALAKELNVPVVALSQLSRAVEQRDDKRPQLSDLRESGSIEQDADVVLFVYREQYYLERAEPGRKPEETEDKFMERHRNWLERCEKAHNVAEVIVAKQRHGPIGGVKLYFDGNYTKFGNLIAADHVPEEF